jgi:transcriptional regulator with XRE-family HTH domain
MAKNVHHVRIAVNRPCAPGVVARHKGSAQNAVMAKKPASRHFIRAWRKERGLTLEQLAERIGMTHQNLGKIERGLVPYNQVLLELLAEELRCDPADLIMRDPAQKNSLWTIYEALTPVQRQQLVEIGETLKKTG